MTPLNKHVSRVLPLPPNPTARCAPRTKIVNSLPLQHTVGHLFVESSGESWLLDTGAPTSFGTARNLCIAGEEFFVNRDYLGLTAATLSRFAGVPCVGLIGADILGRFDQILDVPGGTLTLSAAELNHDGQTVHLDDCMGIPIVTVRIGGRDWRMFFDTGAQFSYFQDESLTEFPSAGQVSDFYPGVGLFRTETHTVPVILGGVEFSLRCGTLPDLLAATLLMANTAGIVGNAILLHRTIAYFPRRRMMIL